MVDPDITPPDDDPENPIPGVGTYTETSVNIRIRGAEQHFESSVDREIWVDVEGDLTNKSVDIRIRGDAEGTIFHW